MPTAPALLSSAAIVLTLIGVVPAVGLAQAGAIPGNAAAKTDGKVEVLDLAPVDPSYQIDVSAHGGHFAAVVAKGSRVAVSVRFWLDSLSDTLLVLPTRELARDANNLDEQVISRLVGLHAETAGQAEEATLAGKSGGAPDRLVIWFSDTAHRFEERLIFRKGGGLGQLMQYIGDYLRDVENLLERPRYLLLLIMATLVVIL